jgi:hypothetical protein
MRSLFPDWLASLDGRQLRNTAPIDKIKIQVFQAFVT